MAALLVAGCAIGPAGASLGDEWEAFQKKVAKACIDRAMAGDFKSATAQVDPFGTETYRAHPGVGHPEVGQGREGTLRHGQ